jgi:hypothetical protein
MIRKICIRWLYNFKKYLNREYYQKNHPDGVSYPNIKRRIIIAWKLRNEPTFDEKLKELYEKKF